MGQVVQGDFEDLTIILGTAAVMTKLHYEGRLSLNTEFVHQSIVGTQFIGKLIGETTVRTFIFRKLLLVLGRRLPSCDPRDYWKGIRHSIL